MQPQVFLQISLTLSIIILFYYFILFIVLHKKNDTGTVIHLVPPISGHF